MDLRPRDSYYTSQTARGVAGICMELGDNRSPVAYYLRKCIEKDLLSMWEKKQPPNWRVLGEAEKTIHGTQQSLELSDSGVVPSFAAWLTLADPFRRHLWMGLPSCFFTPTRSSTTGRRRKGINGRARSCVPVARMETIPPYRAREPGWYCESIIYRGQAL